MSVLGFSNQVYEANRLNETNESFAIDVKSKNFNELALSWQMVNVKVPSNNRKKYDYLSSSQIPYENEPKEIIRNVSGIALPGKLLAIMGSSGAGKTTLLNVLTLRTKGNLQVQADIRINGKAIENPTHMASISGYVQQNELFMGTLKVREHLKFHAMLRIGHGMSDDEKEQLIDEILTDLNLKKCENTLIGSPNLGIKGISGGEMKRLAFASEIITNPSLLFCDEPTSGLDSFMAASIVDCLKNLTTKGKTIICTIHQPSSDIFEKFDQLYLMAEGRVAFSGDISEASYFFSSLNHRCPSNYNPADFFIKTLAIEPENRNICQERVSEICDAYEKSEFASAVQKNIIETRIQNEHLSYSTVLQNKLFYKTNSFTQLTWLIWRNSLAWVRSPIETEILAIQTFFLALMFGLMYFHSKLNQEGVQNLNGVIFLLITNSSFPYVLSVINSFPSEIPIFLKEHGNAMYRVINYYLAKTTIEIPIYFVFAFLYATIAYWMTGMNETAEKYFTCCAVIVLVALTAISFGSFLSLVTPSLNAALALAGPLTVPLMVFSGYFLNNKTVPVYFIWLKYLSWMGYANEILVVNQWKGIEHIECDNNSTRCLLNGQDVISSLNMDKVDFSTNFALIGVLIVLFRVLAFIFLYIRTVSKK